MIPIHYSIRSLTARKTRSLLTILGVAVVVFITVLMMGLSRGLIDTAAGSASPDNVMVLSYGAEAMEFSAIEPADFHLFSHGSSIKRAGAEPLASPEVYLATFVGIPGLAEDKQYRGVIRGILPIAFDVHQHVRLIAGETPSEGFNVTVGRLAATKLGVPEEMLQVGRAIDLEGQSWRIAGIFEAPGTLYESEIWAHLDDLMAASRRRDYSAVTITAADAGALEKILFDLNTRTDVRVRAIAEREYYAAAAASLRPIAIVAQVITVILVIGGIMAGMNTMFAAVLGRTREMAILMVRGYKRSAILLTLLLESLLLCIAGGIIGCAVGLLLNDLPMRMPMSAFRFVIDSHTVLIGLVLAAFIGTAGALFPLMRVMRLPIIEALRNE